MKKGISLIVLVITIIILGILAGVAVVNMNPVLADTAKSQLQMEIAQLEALMNTYRIRKNGVINFDTVAFDTSTLSDVELEQFAGETITDSKIQLYVIDLLEIDVAEVNFGNLESGTTDRYLYSNITGKVYYEQGLEADGIIYYYVENGEG